MNEDICQNAKNKYPELRKQFQTSLLKNYIDDFENGGNTDKMPKGYGLNIPILSPNKPLFTSFIEDAVIPNRQWNFFDPKRDVLINEKEFVFILNAEAPYTDAYPQGKEGSAGMALTHLLGLPKKRIFNAVSLKKDDIGLLKRMKSSVQLYLNKKTNREDLINRVESILQNKLKLNNIHLAKQEEILTRFKIDSNRFINLAIPSEHAMEYYFHPSPCHSVGHLHMHTLPKYFRTSPHHDDKSVKVDTIINYLENPNNSFGKMRFHFNLITLKRDLKLLKRLS